MNWDSIRDEAAQYLRDLLRIDTTNPPGNETLAVEFLAGILKSEGIEPMIFESAPGRGNLVARLKGDGRAAPLLLMAHLDVVPAEAEKWTHPPFAGDLVDGKIWGRGALDTKDLAAMQLMVMLLLKRDGAPLSRDVIWMTNADEETGGNLGAGWMVKEHPDLIRAEYALNEGAGFTMDVLGRHFFTVQVGEKGSARFAMRARGNAGHGSMPHRNNAVLKLADAVTRVGNVELPHRVTPVAQSFVEGLAANVDARYKADVLALLDPKKFSTAIARLGSDGNGPMYYAMFHQLQSSSDPSGRDAPDPGVWAPHRALADPSGSLEDNIHRAPVSRPRHLMRFKQFTPRTPRQICAPILARTARANIAHTQFWTNSCRTRRGWECAQCGVGARALCIQTAWTAGTVSGGRHRSRSPVWLWHRPPWNLYSSGAYPTCAGGLSMDRPISSRAARAVARANVQDVHLRSAFVSFARGRGNNRDLVLRCLLQIRRVIYSHPHSIRSVAFAFQVHFGHDNDDGMRCHRLRCNTISSHGWEYFWRGVTEFPC